MDMFEKFSALKGIAEKTLSPADLAFIERMRENPSDEKIINEYISTQYKDNKKMQGVFFRGMFIGSVIVAVALMKGVNDED